MIRVECNGKTHLNASSLGLWFVNSKEILDELLKNDPKAKEGGMQLLKLKMILE